MSEFTELRFEGDVSIYFGAAIAGLAAVGIYILYRRETAGRGSRWKALLPLLRAGIVFLILLMLTGPVLRGSVGVADLSRVLIFVDGSKSMSLTDTTMRDDRKRLSARLLGWVDKDADETALYDASQKLASVRAPNEDVDPSETLLKYNRLIYGAIDTVPDNDRIKQRMLDELGQLADEINEQYRDETLDRDHLIDALGRLRRNAESWSTILERQYKIRREEISPSDSELDPATQELDEWTRWSRAEAMLLTSESALLPELAAEHRVDLMAICRTTDDDQPETLWKPRLPDDPFPETLDAIGPNGTKTDLGTQIDLYLKEVPRTQRLAVVLLSDGQHNKSHGGDLLTSPSHLAQLLGRRGVPIFPIGFGAESPPPDLAVLTVQAPESVFADDRIKGEIVVKDHMPAGQSMQIRVEVEGQRVWTDILTTNGSGARTVQFDFSVKQLVENRIAGSVLQSDAVSVPLPLEISIDPLEEEVREDNNTHHTSVRAITRPRRALLIDGRPRWEFRYLRNMLDRDTHWDVNHVLTLVDRGRHLLPRGQQPGTFPTSREQLFRYDVIFMGEIPDHAFDDEELEWIDQFVSMRGGGLMLIDGQRGKLRTYVDSPLSKLLPVRWVEDHRLGIRDASLALADRGLNMPALSLAGDDESSAIAWSRLPAQRWVAPADAMPGCETLVTAQGGLRTSPALVFRRYGAGNVLYSGFEESWRWRYEVADEFHQRYWNQIANFIMESPYAIHDRFVSIDTGGITYQPGETADLKVRFRDQRGEPIIRTNARAVLYREEIPVATIPLRGTLSGGGVMRGTTQPLQPGTYQLGVEADGYVEKDPVQAEFVVIGDVTGELNALSCNESLLQKMAELSGGQYLREEDASRLPELLAPLVDGKEETIEFALWRSWFLFLPLIGLFTFEWFLRKKLGMM